MILQGDALARLRELPTASIQTCCTSPPYFGLRDYGTGEWTGGDPDCDHSQAPARVVGNAPSASSTLTTNNGMGPRPGDKFHVDQLRLVADACQCGAERQDGQIGLETTPDEYVAKLVDVFREVRRVLRDDGTLWLNIGDSYSSVSGALVAGRNAVVRITQNGTQQRPPRLRGVKGKDLLGIPWMLALALRADGWYLRSDVIWAKPNPMPESVTDRPTSAHEHVFLLAKSQRYFYDADAIREPHQWEHVGATRLGERSKNGGSIEQPVVGKGNTTGSFRAFAAGGRNKRNVWEIATQPYPEAHFATFPTALVEPCVLAGSSRKACGVCGAPWQRVVDVRRDDREFSRDQARGASGKTGRVRGGTDDADSTWSHRTIDGTVPSFRPPAVETAGWEPTCDHDDDSGACQVLDPFVGSGTVGVVCAWHGREFVGIELNPDYCDMARRRIESEGRLGRRAYRPEPAPAGQLELL